MRVAQLRTRTESLGKTCFHIHHDIHTFFGSSLIETCQLIHLLYVRTESVTNLSGSRIIFQIVFTLTHTQTRLIGLYSIHATIHFIRPYIQNVIGNNTFLLHLAQQGIKFFFVF